MCMSPPFLSSRRHSASACGIPRVIAVDGGLKGTQNRAMLLRSRVVSYVLLEKGSFKWFISSRSVYIDTANVTLTWWKSLCVELTLETLATLGGRIQKETVAHSNAHCYPETDKFFWTQQLMPAKSQNIGYFNININTLLHSQSGEQPRTAVTLGCFFCLFQTKCQ